MLSKNEWSLPSSNGGCCLYDCCHLMLVNVVKMVINMPSITTDGLMMLDVVIVVVAILKLVVVVVVSSLRSFRSFRSF